MKLLGVFAVVFFTTQQVEGGILFQETFDGPNLPNSLNYLTDPSFNRWIIDGSNRLFGEKIAGGGGDILAATSKQGFILTNGGLRYSVDVGRPLSTVPGGSNVGLVFGDYIALFHPGFPKDTGGDRGAFRLVEGITSRNILINNTDMGFIPSLDATHHIEAFISEQGSGLAIDLTITGLGSDGNLHTFDISFLDTSPSLGSGYVGVQIQGTNPPTTNDGYFDNLQVEGAVVPEPTSHTLLGIGAVSLFGYGWRRKRMLAA